MTKSQNTKNEQQKDLCITSEQLTEQWKQGELPSGWYYIKIADIVFIDFFEGKVWKNKKDEYIDEVLAPVPSYDEWKASENYIDYLKQCISVYESKDKQATETSIAYNELLEENTKLKELLKECRPYFNALVEKRLKLEYIPQVYELITKINEVLK